MSVHYVTLDWGFIRDKSTTMQEKLIYAEIKQLTQLDRGCIASNQHFADLLGIKRQAASRIIGNLEKKGFITTEIVKGSRNMERKIRCKQNVATCQQNVSEVATKCLETKENKTINKTIIGIFEFWKQICNHKNSKLDDNRKRIILKALDNYSVDEIKKAITGCKSSEYHQGKNPDGKVYDSLGLILRNAENIERFISYNNTSNNKPTDTSGIKSEIFSRLQQSQYDKYEWKNPRAEQAWKRIMKTCNLWQASEYQINQILKEVI